MGSLSHSFPKLEGVRELENPSRIGKDYAKTLFLLCCLNVLSFALNSSFTQLTSYTWIIFPLPSTLMLEV